MVLPVSRIYRDAIAAPHEPYARVEVWQRGVQLEGSLPIVKGAVDANLALRVARKLTLTVANEWYPLSTGDLLAPLGNELRVFKGVAYADGSAEEFPVFRGRITDATMQDDGTVQVKADDRAAEVAEYGFTSPATSVVGARNVDEIQRLIREGVEDAAFGVGINPDIRVPALVWDDRAKACDDLATAINALWYPLADGTFVIRYVPWTRQTDPVLTLTDAGLDGVGGQIIRAVPARSRTDVFNVVTVTSGRADGSVPAVATARDENPSSATYWRGPFGRRTKTIKVQEPLTQAQAKGMADTYLRRYIALNETWKLMIVPDASIELGDVAALDTRGRQVVQVITGFKLPLTIKEGNMTVNTRSLTPVSGLLSV